MVGVNRHQPPTIGNEARKRFNACGEPSKFQNIKKMKTSLIELAKQCPELTVSIKVHDLVEGLNILIGNVKSELEQTISDQQAETYPSRDKVMEILGVSSATLWRWHKSGYLVPLNVGGKRRYRMSDIQKLLKGGNTVAKGGA